MKTETKQQTRRFALGAGLIGLAATSAKGQSMTGSPNDIAVLNYALTLEHLEAAFYVQALQRFSAADFNATALARSLGTGVIAGVYTNLGRIRDHEVAHVQTLQTTIRGLGGTPVGACTYNFSYNNPEQFLQMAAMLENLGVEAYNGAIGRLQAMALKAAGASILTVEARHSSYLELLNLAIPFPKAFDAAKTMQEVLAAAAPIIRNCPDGGGPMGEPRTTAVLLPKNLTTIDRQVRLDASTSTSANGQPLTYQLRSISGSASVLQANSDRPTVQFNGGFGDYVFELTVTDSAGNTATDRITIRYAGQ
jgi:hypothetical protein